MRRDFGLKTALVAVLLTLTVSSSAWADDFITRWNNQALDTARSERLGAAGAARLYAMVNVAMFDAVNGISRAGYRRSSARDFALVPPRRAPRRGDKRAAAAAAAHAVLTELFPDLSVQYDTQLLSDLAELGGGRRVAQGQYWGARVGQQVFELRENDGSSPQEILPAGTGPGVFSRDFTSAQFRNMEPFGIVSAAPYVSAGPPALNSLAYAAAFAEVKLLGNRANPNPLFDEIFNFWRGGGGSARPPGEWIKVALVIADQQGTTDSIDDTARLLALTGMAMADAVIPAWNNKYNFQFWRPATAIHNANTDGNPLTVADPAWLQRNGSIGGSPEHTSGQSTFAGAGSAVIAGFYCTDFISFSFEGDNAIAGSRSFTSLSAAAFEAGRARMMAGIHFEFSNSPAQDAGRRLANEIVTTRLQPLRRGGHDDDDDDGDRGYHHGGGNNAPKCPQS